MPTNLKAKSSETLSRYWAIDDALTFAILQEHIGDLSQFKQEVEAFLRSRDAAADTRN